MAWIHHSPISGHLGCFYFGAITDKAAMNTWVRSFNGHIVSFLLGDYLRMEWLSSIAVISLTDNSQYI